MTCSRPEAPTDVSGAQHAGFVPAPRIGQRVEDPAPAGWDIQWWGEDGPDTGRVWRVVRVRPRPDGFVVLAAPFRA